MPDDAPQPVFVSPYTPAQRLSRIRVYIWLAVLASLLGSIGDLAAMSDDQLHAMSVIRWTLKLLLLVIGATLSGCNAFRAAIDRSTSGPHPDDAASAETTTAAPQS